MFHAYERVNANTYRAESTVYIGTNELIKFRIKSMSFEISDPIEKATIKSNIGLFSDVMILILCENYRPHIL